MAVARSKQAPDNTALTMQAIADKCGVSRLVVYQLVKAGLLKPSVAGKADSERQADTTTVTLVPVGLLTQAA